MISSVNIFDNDENGLNWRKEENRIQKYFFPMFF